MRVLLAVKSKFMEHLGVMHLSSIVKGNGHKCRIVEFSTVKEDCMKWIPDVVGFSVMTGDQLFVKETIRDILGNLLPHRPPYIIIGGPHPTFFKQDFTDGMGLVVMGEAEQFMEKMSGGKRVFSSLDDLPWPDRADFQDMPIRDFITSRGCPHNCAYCYNREWAELYPDTPRVRTRSVSDVIQELVSVRSKFNYFQDSCFGLKRNWLIDFCDKYHRHVGIPFHCHLRPSQIDNEMASHLAFAGCYSLRFALETASDNLRALINRSHTSNREAVAASKYCRKWNIKFMIQNILGLPESTIEDDLGTLEVNIICKPDYGWCSIFQPYPGTVLGEYCIEKGYYTGDFSELSDSFFDESPLNFSSEHKEQVECLQRCFALCVEVGYVPKQSELTRENLPKLIHKIMRIHGDRRLYAGVIG